MDFARKRDFRKVYEDILPIAKELENQIELEDKLTHYLD